MAIKISNILPTTQIMIPTTIAITMKPLKATFLNMMTIFTLRDIIMAFTMPLSTTPSIIFH